MRVELLPVFRLYVSLDELHNVDLHARGYYQIRLSARLPSGGSGGTSADWRLFGVASTTAGPSTSASPAELLPASVTNGRAVSRTVEVVYADDRIPLSSAFELSVQTSLAALTEPLVFELTVELLHAPRSAPPQDSQFRVVSKRTLKVTCDPESAWLVARELFFELHAFAALKMSAFCSLVTAMPRRKKHSTDPPVSARLLDVHATLTQSMLGTALSIARLTARYSARISTPIAVDVRAAERRTSEEGEAWKTELQKSDVPWQLLETRAVQLSSRLSDLYSQLLQLFDQAGAWRRQLISEWRSARLRRLAEGFFYVEHGLLDLTLCARSASISESAAQAVRASNYLSELPPSPLFCEALDAGTLLDAVVVEDRYERPDSDCEQANGHGALKNGNPDEKAEEDPIRNDVPSSAQISLAKQRENVKRKLSAGPLSDARLYSESSTLLASKSPATETPRNAETQKADEPPQPPETHLIVLVHGMEGTPDDLELFRAWLRLLVPPTSGLHFFAPAFRESWQNMDSLADELIEQLRDHISDAMAAEPTRISFIAHSLGGVVVRAALAKNDENVEAWKERLHTFLTINCPHVGLMYAQRHVGLGVSIVRWIKQSSALEQLTLHDGPVRDARLARLAATPTFGLFRNVLLVGTRSDAFVPAHSALVHSCKAALKSTDAQSAAFSEMLANVWTDCVRSKRLQRLVRYTVHASSSANGNATAAERLIGKAAHTLLLADDVLVEKLLAVSAYRYFL